MLLSEGQKIYKVAIMPNHIYIILCKKKCEYVYLDGKIKKRENCVTDRG